MIQAEQVARLGNIIRSMALVPRTIDIPDGTSVYLIAGSKKDFGPTGISQFELVAEDVEKANPKLVVRDKQGRACSVRYDQVNAMLLNEFLKEHKNVEQQKVTIAELRSMVAQQQNSFESKLAKQEEQIEALIAGLQKVSSHFAGGSPSLADLK